MEIHTENIFKFNFITKDSLSIKQAKGCNSKTNNQRNGLKILKLFQTRTPLC
jgi:hypothetical protein